MFLGSGGAFNPVEHLFDRWAAWVSLWGVHGADFVKSWNDSTPGFMHLSQHVFMMWAAAAVVMGVMAYVTFVGEKQRVPKGLRNFIEPIVLFIRDQIARPNIKNPHAHHGDHGHGEEHHGEHSHVEKKQDDLDRVLYGLSLKEEKPKHWLADKLTPFLCCLFFFIAACNLLGLIPGSTTATSAITVTAGFALITLSVYFFGAVYMQGLVGFVVNLVPYKFSLKPLDLIIWFLLLMIELVGLLTKPFALTVRLFANMTAGHCIILSLLFINQLIPDDLAVWRIGTGIPTTLMSVAIYGLEIFVGILQAYIFTYLSAIFIGNYLVPEH